LSYLHKHITLPTDLLKGRLGAVFLSNPGEQNNLNLEPNRCKMQLSILVFTTPRPSCVDYQDYIRKGVTVQAQEMVDEQSSKRERKYTELCIAGAVDSNIVCVEAICNLFCFYSFTSSNFNQSIIWRMFLDFIYLIACEDANWKVSCDTIRWALPQKLAYIMLMRTARTNTFA
jgi:hypothetical protein